MPKEQVKSESWSWWAWKAFVTGLALMAGAKAQQGCDEWTMTSGPINSIEPAGRPFYPLKGAVFESNNTGAPVLSATIYFNAIGNITDFNDLGCPPPLTKSENPYRGLLVCDGSNITPQEFTEAANNLTTSLNDTLPLFNVAYGGGDYTSSVWCGVRNFTNDGVIFRVERAINSAHP